MTRIAVILAFALTACVLDEATEADIAEVESEATIPPPVTELADNQYVTISGAAGSIRYFKIEVPAGYDHLLTYRTNVPARIGADVYVKRGGFPSATSYDCRALDGSTAPCRIDYPAAGTYYILVKGTGTNGYSNMSLHADYQHTYSPIANNTSRSIWNSYGYDLFYKLAVPSGTGSVSFKFTLDPNDDGAVDLVVNHGAFATATAYDCKRWIDWDQSVVTATCTFTNPAPGTYYVGLLGHDTKYVGTFSASYRWGTSTTTTTSTLN